jgi:hypothetical protein
MCLRSGQVSGPWTMDEAVERGARQNIMYAVVIRFVDAYLPVVSAACSPLSLRDAYTSQGISSVTQQWKKSTA